MHNFPIHFHADLFTDFLSSLLNRGSLTPSETISIWHLLACFDPSPISLLNITSVLEYRALEKLLNSTNTQDLADYPQLLSYATAAKQVLTNSIPNSLSEPKR